MRTSKEFILVLLLGLILNGLASAKEKELAELKVLYVGSERTSDYVNFLKGKVALVKAVDRDAFQTKDAANFDVVLLDWPQGEQTRNMRKIKAPLGTREDWKSPTVLLGSAGLNLAVAWKLKGGSGCTCLDPLAYNLREHEIFDKPFRIDRGQMIAIPTPDSFRDEMKEKEINVLPLVADRNRKWPAGWSTHALDFARYPDVELFCGGVNAQTPTSAALWRQGNLLHFGFEQSPAEMNELGQHLLLNSIVYISRFSEDRPIAITPSVFAGPVARSRATVTRWLRNPEYRLDFVEDLVAPEIWKKLSMQPDRAGMIRWAEEHARFLRPDRAQQLVIDDDLVAVNVPFDQPEFFDKVLADLQSTDTAAAARALRLLKRYVPTGPKSDSADTWKRWWEDNRPFAFSSDAGDYCWYVDPLAKKRGTPINELRGPRRADLR